MAKKKAPIRKHIIEGKQALKSVMQENLAVIADAMISQIMSRARRSTPSQLLNCIKNVDQPGVNNYKAALKTALAIIASDAIKQIRKEIPKAKHVKLAEGIHDKELMLSEFDDLPPDVQKRILTDTQNLVGTQLADLEKAIYFQFTASYDSTDSMDLLESDVQDSADDYITGSAIDAGAGIQSAELINTARSAVYSDDEVKAQVSALQFVNGDPVTDICQTLNGVIFDQDDPLADRFQPPFHWNCKTYIIPILEEVDPEDIEDLSSYANLEDDMQFGEDASKVVFLLNEMNNRHRSS
jgi:hypothetical protein